MLKIRYIATEQNDISDTNMTLYITYHGLINENRIELHTVCVCLHTHACICT